jgi:hypothetical protein
MSSIAFALPVAQGKKGADVLKFIDELLDEKASHFKERMKQRGYKRIQVFHQTVPTELFIFYMESDDIHKTLEPREHDGSDFEEWYRKQYEALAGSHVSALGSSMASLVMDWHPEKGGSRKHHA